MVKPHQMHILLIDCIAGVNMLLGIDLKLKIRKLYPIKLAKSEMK